MPRLLRDRVTWLLYALLGLWAYWLYAFSPAVPQLRDEQHVSSGAASLHSLALAVGGVLAGVVSPRLMRRFGRANTMWLSTGGAVLGVTLFVLARPIWLTVPSVFVVSLFGNVLVAGIVATFGERYGRQAPAVITEANGFACAAGAVAPLLLGVAVKTGLGWRPAVAVFIALAGLLAVAGAGFRIRIPASATPHGESHTGTLPFVYWIAWLMLAFTGSVEVCLNLWSSDLLRTNTGIDPGSAATAVAGIIAGMSVGRLIGGRIALRVAPPPLLLGALCLSGVGFALFWLSTIPALAVAGLIVMGLGNGMHYPLGIAMALGVSGGRADLAAGRASYGVAISFGISPLVLGAVSDQIGPRLAFLLVPLLLVCAALLVFPLARRLRLAPAPAPVPAAMVSS